MELRGTKVPQKVLILLCYAELRGTANGIFGNCVCHTREHQKHILSICSNNRFSAARARFISSKFFMVIMFSFSKSAAKVLLFSQICKKKASIINFLRQNLAHFENFSYLCPRFTKYLLQWRIRKTKDGKQRLFTAVR